MRSTFVMRWNLALLSVWILAACGCGQQAQSQPPAATDPFAAPAAVPGPTAPQPGESALVGVVVELGGQVAVSDVGLVFLADDRRAYVGVRTVDAKLRGVSLLAPEEPKFFLAIPTETTTKRVAAEFVVWKNYGSLLVLAAPKAELPAPFPLDAVPECADGQPIRFHALRMARRNNETTYSRSVHSGTIKQVRKLEADQSPHQLFVSADVPSIIGAEMPLGIVSAAEGTPLGRAFEVKAVTPDGRTVYECFTPASLNILRAPRVEERPEMKVGHVGKKVLMEYSLTVHDPFQRIKKIVVRINATPFDEKSHPEAKRSFTMELKETKRLKKIPSHHSLRFPDIDVVEWRGNLEFENYRHYRYSGDDTASYWLLATYVDVGGKTYELDSPNAGFF